MRWLSLRLWRRLSADGIGRDDAADLAGEIHCDRGEDVVAGAAADQELRDVAVRLIVTAVPAGRPPDHLQLVIVAVPDDVAAGVGQTADDVGVAAGRGPVHRVGVVALLAQVGVETAL